MVHLGKVQPARNFLRIILILAVASFALVLVVLYVSFARATVVLFPKEQTAEVKYTATIDASKSYDPAKLDYVAGRIETVEKEGTKKVADVSEKPIPDYAHVTMTIHNNQGGSQPLLANSQLVNADGIKFLTDEPVTVPGGGSVTVGATAAEPGKKYNVEPSRFNFIKLSGSLQSFVYAESTEKATGGERVENAATNAEIKKAQDELINQLETEADAELRSKLKATEQFVPEAVIKKVLDSGASVAEGEETTSFEVTAKVSLTTVVFDENNLLQLSIAKLTASLDDKLELVTYDPKTFNYEISSFDQKNGTAKLSARLNGVSRPRLDAAVYDKEKVKGKSKKEADEYYKQFADIDHIDVRFMPPFVRTIPTIVDKITILVGESESLKEQKAIKSPQ
jgi:hypothetical protein